ncbi:histidinol-phosphatase HisJ family protein [Butyrivibrio sp. MC2013]|uniref:histidinol-phosphatase HisJ family protein n=1 Tax=Butyrivibrio sp. MC2013 TaxID=1280686 RepID=UPI00040EDA40|nr:histidinol-phosphatase HisJ family protein [Butyrivibrio sp. MC2013]
MGRIIGDYHVHSEHSGDSQAPMSEMIAAAKERGLTQLCFTEHMDMDYPSHGSQEGNIFYLDTQQYYDDCMEAKALAKGSVDVRFGVEVGMQPHISGRNSDYIDSWPFDFVIASNHLCNKKDPYYPEFYEGRSKKEAVREFFECTYENIRLFKNYDVLGHLDYIVRYIPEPFEYKWKDYADVTDRILRLLAEEGKGLDVNCKSIFGGNSNEPNPCLGLLKRFRSMGGEIITFGSDAHVPEGVAGGFDKGRDVALRAGFTKYCTFKDRRPSFHDL